MIPQFAVVDSTDDGTRVEFTGTRSERGTNVDILTEMIAVMNASRAYESDASIFDVGKTLAEKTIELERL
jgi:flagellar basal body rod protein FlgG